MINNKLYLKKSSINLFELFGFNIMYTDNFSIWDNNNNEKMITNYIKKNGIYYNNYKLVLKTMDNEKKR